MEEPLPTYFVAQGRPSMRGVYLDGDTYGKWHTFYRVGESAVLPESIKVKISTMLTLNGRRMKYHVESLKTRGTYNSAVPTLYRPREVPPEGSGNVYASVDSTCAPLMRAQGPSALAGSAFVDFNYGIVMQFEAVPAGDLIGFELEFTESEWPEGAPDLS